MRAATRALAFFSMAVALAAPAAAQDGNRRAEVETPDERDFERPPRVALFRSAGFPAVDAPPIADAVLDAAIRDLPIDVLATPEAMNARLRVRRFDVLVLPYGSAFPLASWSAIRAFLERGGGLVVLGGAPFHQPMRQDGGTWVPGPRQPTFARELLIGPAEAVATAQDDRIETLNAWTEPLAMPTRAFALTVRFTTRKDFEREDGSAGPRDAILRPLVHVVRDGLPVACPLFEIDRMRGSDAGARWVLAPSDAALTAPLIRACIARALEGAGDVDVRPVLASVLYESPTLRVMVRRPRVRPGAPVPEVTNCLLSGTPELMTGEIQDPAPSGPGHTVVKATLAGRPVTVSTGWVRRDDELLASGPKLSVSRDWIRKDGEVFPIVGTTYMASDVHRKFLFEPDPHRWARDFAAMKRLGVNFVRTGLWTAWSRAMLDPGAIDEGFLRALDAWVQIAAEHGIVTCFTFFAFQPPAFGGTNPYLDPRALEGQKALLVAVARRFRGCNWVHYDLINEPSYCPADQLWTNRPIGDEWEKRAWTEWVIERFGSDPLVLRDRWRDASSDVLALPKPDELAYAMIREHRRPRKAVDFVRFSNDVVARWAADLRATLRAAGGDGLVTLGQDEGGTHVRPAQQLHADSVDYTAIHTWWNNDDLLWDGVVTKVREKPSLIQETGLMRLEDVDGNPWRTPEAAARLLERKFAYAFMGRGCGAIQWAWNVNPYMPVENESVIGFFRPDGTAKPEVRVLGAFARFFEQIARRLDDFEPDEVVMIVGHGRIFAGRPRGVDPTRRLVRTLSERLGIVPTALSDERLTAERLSGARLVLVPAAELLDDRALAVLREAADRGIKVLVTGSLGEGRPVAIREPTPWGATDGGGSAWATFEAGQAEWLRAHDGPPLRSLEGSYWHEPLPLEFASESAPLVALLEAVAAKAGVTTHPSAVPVAARVLLAPEVALVAVVNETSAAARRRVSVGTYALEVPVEAGRGRLAVVSRASGAVLAATEGAAIERVR
jgi:hypothetical protein